MTFRIDRLTAGQAQAIAGTNGAKLKQVLDKAFDTIEQHVTDLETQLADIQAVTRSDKITASWTVPAAVMTASDAGTSATITIASHTRVYGDGTQLVVAGRTITGLAYSTDYGVYYDDPNCSDQTPSYIATTTAAEAQNNFVTGRHRLGVVTTPASGGTATTGGSLPPGGGGDGYGRYATL